MYERYISRITDTPWAITVPKLVAIMGLIRERANGHQPSVTEIAERLGPLDDSGRSSEMEAQGKIALIPIHGTIAHRADAFSASSGGTSTELVGGWLRQALRDPDVSSILLDIDSPGGNISGVPELAAAIAKGAKQKPIVAHVNAQASSAAYWLATQASEIVSTPSGYVGSIGVYMILTDETKNLENEGVKVNAISAGENKLEGAPWEELTDDARGHFQEQVNESYRQFRMAVARGRQTTVANVDANYGQGRQYNAQQALKRGMIDRVATLEDTIASLQRSRPATSPTADAPRLEMAASVCDAASVTVLEGLVPPSADAVPAGDEDYHDDTAALLAVL